jgi:hypothetical protein
LQLHIAQCREPLPVAFEEGIEQAIQTQDAPFYGLQSRSKAVT